MPKIDVEAYEKRRQKLKAAVDEAAVPFKEIVFSIGQREGEAQSYQWLNNVLNGSSRSRSRPALDKIETDLEERGIV